MSKRAARMSGLAAVLVAGAIMAALFIAGAVGQEGGPSGAQSGSLDKRSFEATEQANQATAAALPTAPAVPFVPPTPAPLPTPFVAGPDVRSCEVADLTALAAEGSGATGGENFIIVELGNKSGSPCALAVPKRVVLLNTDGLPAFQLGSSSVSKCSADMEFACVSSRPLLLLPGLPARSPSEFESDSKSVVPGQALLTIAWWASNYEGDPECQAKPSFITEIGLVLSSSGEDLDVKLSDDLFPEGGIEACRAALFSFNGVPDQPKAPVPSAPPR
jgi:hypothetical protein